METINASLYDTIERIIYTKGFTPKTKEEIYKDSNTSKEDFARLFLNSYSFELSEEGVYFTVDKSAEKIKEDMERNERFLNSQINFLKKAYHKKEEYKNQLDVFLPRKGLTDILERIKQQPKG